MGKKEVVTVVSMWGISGGNFRTAIKEKHDTKPGIVRVNCELQRSYQGL